MPDGDFDGDANGPAAGRGGIVILCVPFRNQVRDADGLKEHVREGQLVVDATVPLAAAVSGRATRMLGVWQGSAAQQAAEMVPDGVRVCSALHTVSAAALSRARPRAGRGRARLRRPKADKRAVAELDRAHPGAALRRLPDGSSRRASRSR